MHGELLGAVPLFEWFLSAALQREDEEDGDGERDRDWGMWREKERGGYGDSRGKLKKEL